MELTYLLVNKYVNKPSISGNYPMAKATSPTTLNSRRRTQVERRETAERRILQAAIGIVADKGLNGLTLAAAGETAGYSRGIASHHFGRKADLLVAIVKHITTQFSLSLGEHRDVPAGLAMILEVIREYFGQARQNPRTMRALHLVLSEGVSNPDLQEALATANERSLKGLTAHLHRGMENGEIRRDIDPKAQAIVILAGLRGITAQWLIDDRGVNLDQARDAFIATTRRSLAP